MNLRTIAFNNLRRRKSRMVFLVAGLMIGIATVVTLLSLSAALTMETEHKLDTFGANILITPQSEDLSLSYGGITLGGISVDVQPIRQRDLLRIFSIPSNRNIAAVAPKVLGAVAIGEQRVLLMGVNQEVEFHLKRWWQVEGRPLAADDELVAGHAVARRLGLTVGRTLGIGGENFTVTGILQETGSQDDHLLVSSLPVAQRLFGKEGLVSLVEVAALCAECPVEEMVEQIAAVLPGVRVNAIQQVVAGRLHALEQFKIFSLGVAAVVIVIGALVVFVTMTGSVNERTREIGIFRALGFRRGHVVRLILMEAAAVSLLAGVLGFLGGMGVTRAVLPFLAQEHPHLIWSLPLAAGALALALLVGMAASLYPALQASRLDPTEALRAL